MIHAREDYNEGKMDTIPEDEPVFLLRAQDSLAIDCVKHWCHLARVSGVDEEMIVLAEIHIERMEAWPVRKTPDM